MPLITVFIFSVVSLFLVRLDLIIFLPMPIHKSLNIYILFIYLFISFKRLYKDYATGANSCVSSLAIEENLAVAGFGDGTIKVIIK